MSNKVVLIDLENNTLTAKILRDIIEHYPTVYIFNCKNQFEYALEDLTELATWMSAGQLVVLDTPSAEKKEFEYAVVIGQLIALLEPETHIEILSAMPNSDVLLHLLTGTELTGSLIQIQSADTTKQDKKTLPTAETIQKKPHLKMVKKYCDALGKMTGKPNTVEKLKNSIANILQVVPEKAQHLIGMLINLKIVKRYDDQIAYRKKILKQWISLDLNSTQQDQTTTTQSSAEKLEYVDQLLAGLKANTAQHLERLEQHDAMQDVQSILFKNFSKIDPIQMQVIHKLNELKTDKPKDIYALRDLLEQMFPKSDVRLLLKELIEKGYIYWNGHEVVYSHEMYLN